jgi:hypothetical protein
MIDFNNNNELFNVEKDGRYSVSERLLYDLVVIIKELKEEIAKSNIVLGKRLSELKEIELKKIEEEKPKEELKKEAKKPKKKGG